MLPGPDTSDRQGCRVDVPPAMAMCLPGLGPEHPAQSYARGLNFLFKFSLGTSVGYWVDTEWRHRVPVPQRHARLDAGPQASPVSLWLLSHHYQPGGGFLLCLSRRPLGGSKGIVRDDIRYGMIKGHWWGIKEGGGGRADHALMRKNTLDSFPHLALQTHTSIMSLEFSSSRKPSLTYAPMAGSVRGLLLSQAWPHCVVIVSSR